MRVCNSYYILVFVKVLHLRIGNHVTFVVWLNAARQESLSGLVKSLQVLYVPAAKEFSLFLTNWKKSGITVNCLWKRFKRLLRDSYHDQAIIKCCKTKHQDLILIRRFPLLQEREQTHRFGDVNKNPVAILVTNQHYPCFLPLSWLQAFFVKPCFRPSKIQIVHLLQGNLRGFPVFENEFSGAGFPSLLPFSFSSLSAARWTVW